MADYIKREYAVDPELIEGSGGVFDVTFNNKLIFSKKQTHRFPEEEEIRESVENLK